MSGAAEAGVEGDGGKRGVVEGEGADEDIV